MPPKSTKNETKNDDILEKMETLLNTKFCEFEKKLDKVTNNMEASIAQLKDSLQMVDAKAQKALDQIEAQVVDIKTNSTAIESINDHVEILKSKLKALYDQTDDLKNRSLRNTLIFRNVPKSPTGEQTWQDVKHHLASNLNEIMDDHNLEDIKKTN